MKLFPILLFVYNRPEHTRKTIEALKANLLANESEIYIFCDGPKTENDVIKINETQKLIESVNTFKKITIYKSDINKGLANSVISGVEMILETNEAVIVLEDDIITNNYFLTYMNTCLNQYSNNKDIFSVTGYLFNKIEKLVSGNEVFLSHRGSSWGWGTWDDRWKKIKWNLDSNEVFKDLNKNKQFDKAGNDYSFMLRKQLSGKIDSWAIRFMYSAYLNNQFHLIPPISLIDNIGLDGTGVHSGNEKVKRTKLFSSIKPEINYTSEPILNLQIAKGIKEKYSKSLIRRSLYSISKVVFKYLNKKIKL